jgi:hypothetical protein
MKNKEGLFSSIATTQKQYDPEFDTFIQSGTNELLVSEPKFFKDIAIYVHGNPPVSYGVPDDIVARITEELGLPKDQRLDFFNIQEPVRDKQGRIQLDANGKTVTEEVTLAAAFKNGELSKIGAVNPDIIIPHAPVIPYDKVFATDAKVGQDKNVARVKIQGKDLGTVKPTYIKPKVVIPKP